MQTATWVELGLAVWAAGLCIEIGLYAYFLVTIATENGRCIESLGEPDFCRMVCFFFVALITGIIHFAALEFDGNDIEGRMIVATTGVCIDQFATQHNRGFRSIHCKK